MLTRTLVSAVALTCALSLPSFAGTFADPGGRFTVNLPADWEAAQPDSKQIAVVMGKKSDNEILGLCIVVVTDTPQTTGKSQAEVDTAMGGMLTKDFWQATYRAQGAQDIQVSTIGSRDVAGRKVHYVLSEFTNKGQSGALVKMKAREEVHALPGRMHDIGCLARVEKYELAKADFEAVLKSYSPQSGLIAQAPAPSSVLTLYAQAGFGGVARVVTAETPNITYVSWPTQSGSATVSGFGEWQVCDGIDFSGNCTLLSGPYSAPANQLLRISSARPIGSPDPIRGAASAISTNSIAILNEAMKHLSTVR